MDLAYDGDLRGRRVIDARGRLVGDLQGFEIDTSSWRVRALRVKVRREVAGAIGLARGTFRGAVMVVAAEAISGVGDAVVLNKSIEALAKAEGIAAESSRAEAD